MWRELLPDVDYEESEGRKNAIRTNNFYHIFPNPFP